MAQSPVVVKDYSSIVRNPRQELFEESIDKIIGGKGIILKGYKTEKMRIEEHLKNVTFNYQQNNKEYEINSSKFPKENKICIKQPQMRFKPRSKSKLF